MSLNRLDKWQYENVQRACNDAVREALANVVDANELRQMMAQCWFYVLTEKAKLGQQALSQR